MSLICYCLTSWVEGSTSCAIYGSKQKEFMAYSCIEYDNWYHKHCLKTCNVRIPGRFEDFICSYCKIPSTIQWSHNEYTDTCTSDNILTIFLLHCKQNPNFLNAMGETEIEHVLKAGLSLMVSRKIYEGKTVILKHVQSQLNLPMTLSGKYDCLGTEFCKFLCLFRHIWKTTISLECKSSHCPSLVRLHTRNLSSVSFYSGTTSFLEQLKELFPECSTVLNDNCDVQFSTDFFPNSLHRLIN